MKQSLRVIIIIAVVSSMACSGLKPESDYCKAIAASVPTKGVSVRHLHIFGTRHHGSIAVSTECVLPLNFSSIYIPQTNNVDVERRIHAFNVAVFDTPRTKKTGMFEFDGVVDIFPERELVNLVDVHSFRETDEVKSRQIFDQLHASRSR